MADERLTAEQFIRHYGDCHSIRLSRHVPVGYGRLSPNGPAFFLGQWLEVSLEGGKVRYWTFHVRRWSETLEEADVDPDLVFVDASTRGQIRTLARALGIKLTESRP